MSREFTWAHAHPIVERLLALPPEQREQALAHESGDDPRLREKLARLLRAADRRRELFEPPSSEAGENGEPLQQLGAPAAGASIGPWRLVRSLGAGGMGEVWLVEREGADFRQRAALKLVKRGMDTDAVLARFRRERKVLAGLTHPAIPSLIDGGASDDGRPYLVMELVEGEPLDDFVRSHALDLDARLRLFLAICDAVQHAHERGVVHRDLKPSNVLVTSTGEPKLLDFGISKVLEGSEESHTLDLTLTGQHMLTPRYASPEQVLGREVTAASDVYALGLILWELLVGRPAVSFDGLTQADFVETVCEHDVPRPSTAVEANATSLKRAIAGDLDTICAMALRKEPARRYASVKQLADDVRRHLEAKPVLARADTVTYRVSKFVRRNRLLVGATFGIMLALAVGLAIAVVMFLRSEDSRRLAERRLDDAEHYAYQAAIRGAYTALQSGNPTRDMNSQPVERRGWEWKHLTARNDCTKRVVWRTEGATPIALGGAGRLLAISERAEVVIVDLEADEERTRIAVRGEPVRLALSPNGAWLASALETELQMYDVATGELAWSQATPNRTDSLCFSPDGTQILSGHLLGALRTTAVECAEQTSELVRAKGMVRAFSFSRDGALVALVGGLSDVIVLRVSDRKILDRYTHPDNPQYLRGVALLGKDRYVASVDNNGRTAVWDRTTDAPLPSTADNDQYCRGLATRPDKDELVIIGNHVRIWSLATGASRTLPGVHLSMQGLEMHPTRPLAYTTCPDGRVHEWDVSSEQTPVLPIRAETDALAISPDGRFCALRSHSGVLVRVWDSSTNRVVESEHFKPDIAQSVAFNPRGDRVVIGRSDGLHLLDATTLARRERVSLADPQLFTAPTVDGVAYVALKDGSITRVDLERLEALDTRRCPLEGLSAIASDKSGAWFAATSTKDASVVLTNWRSGDWRTLRGSSTTPALSVAFSPESRWIAVGGEFVRVHSVESGEVLFDQPTERVKSLAFTRNGDRLLAPAGAHLLVIHTGRWSVLATFKDNNRFIHAIAYCPVTESVFASDVTRETRHYRAVQAPRIDSVQSN